MQKIITSDPKVLWKTNCILGEGTLWVKEHKSIYFVDIKKKKIFRLNIINKRREIIKIDKEIGFLSHIKGNVFILGLKGELRIQNLKTKKVMKSILIEKDKRFNRINDGKTDPKGNLWFGTMDNLERNIKLGSLYCLNKNLHLTKIDKDYIITNGPAFINSNNFYHTDSRKKIIYKIKINSGFKIIEKKIFKKFLKKDGSPDGMTLDINNNLWVAHYGGSKISVLDKKGNLIHVVKLPVKNITNCTFGGKDYSEVFITSAQKSMSKSDVLKYRFSGSLFSVKSNIKGIDQKKFILNNAKKRSLL